jgi:replication initiation protein RepC
MAAAQVTTGTVEAPTSYAQDVGMVFDGAGSVSQQPYFKPVARRDLMAAVNATAKDLGIGPTSVVVLDALLSCLPCNDPKTGTDAWISPQTLLTVFACNDTLCFRAKGITDRQLRRHLCRLEEIQLIRRRDSANGKRFPIKRDGKIVAAFGIDLSPLLERADEIQALAVTKRDQRDELRGLRAQIQCLSLRCRDLDLKPELAAFVDGLRTVMRRATTTLHHARDLLSKLLDILSSSEPVLGPSPEGPTSNCSQTDHAQRAKSKDLLEPTKLPATDGQNVRHKETINSETKKDLAGLQHDLWDQMTTVPAFYPQRPSTGHELMRILYEFGQMLRISTATLANAVSCIGPARTILIADAIAGKPDQVLNPEGYLIGVIQHAMRAKVGRGQLHHAASPGHAV